MPVNVVLSFSDTFKVFQYLTKLLAKFFLRDTNDANQVARGVADCKKVNCNDKYNHTCI